MIAALAFLAGIAAATFIAVARAKITARKHQAEADALETENLALRLQNVELRKQLRTALQAQTFGRVLS